MAGMSSGPEARWTRATTLDELKPGAARVLRVGREQIALFRLWDGRIFAVDNRCPHEGYPLVQGAVSGQTLTCVWHNFKFDLEDGACLLGDEGVRAYPVRVVDEAVEVDLSPPDREGARARLWQSLATGLAEGEVGRMARDVARLIDLEVAPAAIAAFAARWDAEHAEYGTTHALAVAADLVGLLPRWPGEAAVLPLTQLLELTSRPSIRRPPRPRPAPVDPGEDPVAAGGRLRALVEAEEVGAAEALMRGALARGWGRAELEPWLLTLCADHFLDFGHALIFTVKAMDLLEAVGWADADPILPALVVSIGLGTREDLLPPWAGARRRLEIVAADLPRWAAMARGPRPGWTRADDEGPRGLRDAILDGGAGPAFNALREALEIGAPLERICDALVLAASERLLRFDTAIARRVDLQNDWLDLTHLLTFSSAAREALSRRADPHLLRLLFQAAHFIGRAGALDGPRARWSRPARAEVSALLAAVQAKDAPTALGQVEALAATPEGLAAMEEGLLAWSVDDPGVRGIVVAHAIKTLVAALLEARRTGSALPLLGAVRFAASPLRERRVARAAHDAAQLVFHGRIPRDLTASSAGRQGAAGEGGAGSADDS